MAEEQEVKIIRGTVVRLFHQSATFCAGKLVPARSDVACPGEITFAGKVYVREGEAVALRGRWADHEKYGRQFAVAERLVEESTSPDGLAAWLQVHGAAHGIGRVRAGKIAAEFGDNFAGWLRDNPEQVAIVAQVPLETVRELAKSWEEQEQLNQVGMQLAKWQLTANQIHALFEKFKGSVVAILEENPYLLVGEVPGLGFRKVDGIALKVGVPPDHPGRADAALRFCLQEEEGEGSTCMHKGALLEAAVEVLKLDATPQAEEGLAARLAGLVEAGKVRRLEAGGREWYALPGSWRHEEGIAAFLRASARGTPAFPGETSVDAVYTPWFENLDESQQRAVEAAIRHRICLISGGAGSGKTTTIRAIANIYRECASQPEEEDPFAGDSDWDENGEYWEEPSSRPPPGPVLLCAPTGKAARRLEEVVAGFEASTIHRLLQYCPKQGGFQHHSGNPLRATVVIVDEVSMLESSLAHALFDAVGPETAVVLVGDHHQLPPVGPGALLRDAIQYELLPMALLNQCHRQAGPLKQNCQAVLKGEVAPTVQWEGEGPGPWYVHRQLHTPADVARYAERLFVETITGRLGYDPVADVQFLTAKHEGPLGTRALNALLQRLHQRRLGVQVEPPANPEARPKLLLHDKVIQTRNNYDLDVMNGHQGVVVSVAPLVVRFGEREVPIPKDCTGDVELAYCLTPHKVQGSEFPCVVVVCHKVNGFMHHRNWLYTAVTRARQTCIVLGDPDGVRRAAERVVNNQRRTLLPLFAVREEEQRSAAP